MNAPVYSLTGTEKGRVNIARAFSGSVRTDLIKRAVLAEQSLNRQPYGADKLAGKRTSAHYHGKRHYRYSMMNREMARMKRIHGSGYLSYTARFVPQAIKGRKAHPPKVEKNWVKRINKKEWLKAFYSAIAATGKKDIVSERNHSIGPLKHIPLIIDDKIQEMTKTKDVIKVLEKLGLEEELKRTSETKIRAGRGKIRGRKKKSKAGPLIIVSEDKGIGRAAKNLPGAEVVMLSDLNVEMLAPGTVPGRLCIWTKSAMETFAKTEK